MIFSKSIPGLLAVFLLCAAAKADAVFTFDSDTLGTATGFTDTVNGLSATFSSSGDPGGFVIFSSMFDTLTGNVLGDPGPAGLDGLSLTIDFSRDISALTLDFATADFGTPSPLTITAFENAAQIGSSTSTGQVPSGFIFPEGEIAFNGGIFNQVVISSPAPDIVIDNVDGITATATPEPSALVLAGLGLLALGLLPVSRRSLGTK